MPAALTCGAVGENAGNNRLMAFAAAGVPGRAAVLARAQLAHRMPRF